MQIDCEFPGGNIVVEHIGATEVRLRQDLRDTEGEWFYWYFRVRGAAGKTVRFCFTGSVCIGSQGPALSRDGGASWQWLGDGESDADGNVFTYTFAAEENDVRFAMGLPYLERDWRDFLERYRGARFEEGVLCHSAKGTPVELLRLPATGGQPQQRLLFTGRHHCCEATASYVLEGLAGFLLGDDPQAVALRQRAECVFVPFVDKDGVQDGDQGKNRRPHDHNRDYVATGIYPQTRAIRNWVLEHADRGLAVALDFHCPCLRSECNEKLFFVGNPQEGIAVEEERFCEILQKTHSGPLPYDRADNIGWNVDWNRAANFSQGQSFAHWVAQNAPAIQLVSTVEVPYAKVGGVQVTADNARAFGVDVGRALAQYLAQATITSP